MLQQITAMIYLKVSISDFLTLFSSRSRDNFFWTNRPSNILLVAAGCALTVSTIMANVWPLSQPDHIPTEGLSLQQPKIMSLYVWIYCFIFFIIQDVIKVLAYRLIRKFNLMGVNDEAKSLNNTHKVAGDERV